MKNNNFFIRRKLNSSSIYQRPIGDGASKDGMVFRENKPKRAMSDEGKINASRDYIEI
jgi:hypothetical protein